MKGRGPNLQAGVFLARRCILCGDSLTSLTGPVTSERNAFSDSVLGGGRFFGMTEAI